MLTWPSPGALIATAAVLTAAGAIVASVASWRIVAEQDRQIAILEAWSTGGDSYAYFIPLVEPHRLAFFIQHAGRYPAFDVYVRVQNGRGELLQGPIYWGTLSSGSGVDWLTLSPSLVLPRQPGSKETEMQFRIEIQTRNGIVVQRITATPIKGRWHTNSVDIERVKAGETITPIPLGRLNPGHIREAQEQY